jgi:hypothetical protein
MSSGSLLSLLLDRRGWVLFGVGLACVEKAASQCMCDAVLEVGKAERWDRWT